MKLNHKGYALYMALGIVLLFMTSITMYTSYIVTRSIQINKVDEIDVGRTQAMYAVKDASHLISIQESVSPELLDSIELATGTTITAVGAGTYEIVYPINENYDLIAYIKAQTLYEIMFTNLFVGGDDLPEFITVPMFLTTLMNEYVDTHFGTPYPAPPEPPSTSGTFQDVMNYIDTLSIEYAPGESYYADITPAEFLALEASSEISVADHIIVKGDVTLPDRTDLSVTEPYVLFIDGNLTLGPTVTVNGTIVVDGNVTVLSGGLAKSYSTILSSGTITSNFTNLGNAVRPSYLFSESTFYVQEEPSGYAYFLATDYDTSLTTQKSTVSGGVYATVEELTDETPIVQFFKQDTVTDADDFDDYNIIIQDEQIVTTGYYDIVNPEVTAK